MTNETKAAMDVDTVEQNGRLYTVRQIAEAYGFARPDDDFPIDEHWLRSVGFHELITGRLQLGIIHAWREGSWSLSNSSHVIPIPRPKTRGDLRRLASAVGETLSEGGT